jgi:hypothetical protein
MMIAVVITSTSVCLFTAIALLAIRLADSRKQARQDKAHLVAAIVNYKETIGRKYQVPAGATLSGQTRKPATHAGIRLGRRATQHAG